MQKKEVQFLPNLCNSEDKIKRQTRICVLHFLLVSTQRMA